MDTKLVIDILQIVVYLILGFATWYCQTNKKLQSKVTNIINEAEKEYADVAKSGGQKHQYVIDKLYTYIPAPLRLIVSKDMVSSIVDNAFSQIESYAKQQLDKVVDENIK